MEKMLKKHHPARRIHLPGFWILMAPALIVTFLFTYFPAFHWIIAFLDYKINLGLLNSPRVGFRHFLDFLNNRQVWQQLLLNTLIMNLGGIVLSVILGLLISCFIQTIKSRIIQAFLLFVSVMPFFISWASLATIVDGLLAYNDGFVNNILASTGHIRMNFLGDAKYAWVLMIAISTWKETGFFVVVYHSAMCRIDAEYYEEAELIGANTFQKIMCVTLPQIRNVIIVLFVLEIGWVFSSDLDKYYLFTNPTNITNMEVLDMYVYRYGLKLGRFSYAAAVSILKTLFSILVFAATYLGAKKMQNDL